jgi:tetratricopeptide (TPR) repeat protein/DNA-binding winged helix-turn-helix (wHTH) protein
VRNELLDGFRLRDKRIEPLTGAVLGEGADSHLPSKSIEVLLCLAMNSRELVSREELLEKVWGDASASQESLNHTISEIRHALGDHTDHPEFIQTVPKRGYRLLVEPQLLRQEDTTNSAASKPKRSTWVGNLMDRGVIQAGGAFILVGWVLIQVVDAVVPIVGLPIWTIPFVTYTVIGGFPVVVLFAWFFEYAEGRFYLDRGRDSPTVTTGLEKNYLTMVAAYVVTVVGALIYQFSIGFEVPVEQPVAPFEITASSIEVEPNSIAVLRFMNIDGSDRSNIFSQGFAEDVLDRLARVPGLLVSARGDSWSLPVNSSSDEIRRRLRVAYYLEGSVQLVDDELRVVAQLINSATGFHIVSRSFDRNLENFMDVQAEITELTVANLRVALPEETQMIFANDYEGPDIDAYVHYRRGHEMLALPMNDRILSKAIDSYHQALAIDPDYAAAHAGLCSAYTISFVSTNDEQFIDKAEAACASGMAANSNLHMVYSAMGDLYEQTGRLVKGEAAYLKAIDINPQDVVAMQGLASIYERQQDLERAVNLLDEATRLQPGNWRTIDTLGGLLFQNGKYAEAADAYRRVVALDPDNFQGHGNLGSSLMMIGDFEAAAESLQRSIELDASRIYYSNLAIIYYYLGRFDESVAIQRQAVEESPNQNYVLLNLCDALLFSIEPEKADEAFHRAAEIAESILAVDAANTSVMYELAWAKAMLGDVESARKLIDNSLSIDPDNPYVHYYDALLSVLEGNQDEAITALAKAVEGGYPAIMLINEPHLTDLYDRRDFRDLVSSVN